MAAVPYQKGMATPFIFVQREHQKTNLLFGLIGNLAPGVIVERLHTLVRPFHGLDVFFNKPFSAPKIMTPIFFVRGSLREYYC